MPNINQLMQTLASRNPGLDFAISDSVPHPHFQVTVNWFWVLQIIYSYCFNKALADNSRTSEVKEGFLLPTVTRHDTNWPAVERQTRDQTIAIFERVYDTLVIRSGNVDAVVNELAGYARQSRHIKQRYWDNYQNAMRATMQSIHRQVEQLERNIAVARFIRDTSADVVLTLATGSLGTMGLAARGGLTLLGAGMKGTFKFQDTRNVGAATVTFATELTFALIPLKNHLPGAAAPSVQQELVTLIITSPLKGASETGIALIEGDSMRDALIKGGKTTASELIVGGVSNRVQGYDRIKVPAEQLGKLAINQLADVAIPVKAEVKPQAGKPQFDLARDTVQIQNIIAGLMTETYVRERAIYSERIASAA